jgi:hypothetical protein
MQSNGSNGFMAPSIRGRDYLKRGSAQLTDLQTKLTEIGHEAYALWAAWAGHSLKAELKVGGPIKVSDRVTR